jgi:hypothetical protein
MILNSPIFKALICQAQPDVHGSAKPDGISTSDKPTTEEEINEHHSSDDDDFLGLTASLQQLELNTTLPRFFGESSGARLVKSAMAMKSNIIGVEAPSLSEITRIMRSRRPELWSTREARTLCKRYS